MKVQVLSFNKTVYSVLLVICHLISQRRSEFNMLRCKIATNHAGVRICIVSPVGMLKFIVGICFKG